jgi:hypothetical protein
MNQPDGQPRGDAMVEISTPLSQPRVINWTDIPAKDSRKTCRPYEIFYRVGNQEQASDAIWTWQPLLEQQLLVEYHTYHKVCSSHCAILAPA